MSRASALLLTSLGLLGLGASAFAQTSAAAAKPSHAVKSTALAAKSHGAKEVDRADSTSSISVVQLDFEVKPAIPWVPASPIFAGPIFCSPSGIPYVDFPQPPDYMSHVIYSLNPKGGHEFSAKDVPGLYDPSSHAYFVSESMVGLLVNATKDGKKSSRTLTLMPGMPPRAISPGAHHDYLVEFDRQGNFKKTLDLPATYHFWRIAELPDETFLALAYDRVNAVPLLFLLNSDGQILRTLELPNGMTQNGEMTQGETGGITTQVAAESGMSWWLFAPARKDILLYQARSKAPVLEVGAGGVVREVPLQAPKGYVLDDVISASDRWIMRYRKDSISDKGPIDAGPRTKNFVLFEVNPSDGSLRAQFDPGKVSISDIACEHDDVVTAFSMKDGKVILKTADLPR
ncbi:MAG TPA: hypothetical protein VMV57_14880 [Terracidiphilus sp.]|nr:hypothetical protein [Terracidiphilus sp.]